MKLLTPVKIVIGLGLLAYGITAKVSPQTIEQIFAGPAPTFSGPDDRYTLVEGSIYDGDTFRVISNSNQEIKVRLCGIDSPEKEQAFGVEARDHLRKLIDKGNGQIILAETDIDQYGRTIAEAFIPLAGSDKEIHLNSQMVADGYAYVYPQYVNSCPNAVPIQSAERIAKTQSKGVWRNASAQKP